MPVYLSEWELYDDGNPTGEAWRPASGEGWIGGLLDLRERTGRNLCVLEYDAPLLPVPSGVFDLSSVWEEVLSGGRANRVADFLLLPRNEVQGQTVQQVVLQLFGASRPRKDGRGVVWCGRRKLRDERLSGPRKATVDYVETWPDDGALNVTTQDFEYAEQTAGGDDADWVVSGGACTVAPPSGQTRTWNLRTLNRQTDTVDAYAKGTAAISAGESNSGRWTQGWVGCRGHETEATFYMAMVEENNGQVRGHIRKSINNSRSNLTSLAAVSLPGEFGVEADGDQIVGTGLLSAHGPVTDTQIDGSGGQYGYIGGFSDRPNNTVTWDTWGFGDLGLGPPPAIEHVASATASGTTGATGWSATIPATTQEGDIITVLVESRNHTAGTAFPSVTDNRGNTYTHKGSTPTRRLSLYWARAVSGSAGGTVSVSGCVNSATGGIDIWRNALDTGDPLDTPVFEENASGNESHASYTPTEPDSFVCFGVGNHTNDTLSVTNLAAATLGTLEPEFWNRLSTGGSDCYAILTGKLSPGGPTATGTFTWSQTNSATDSVAFAIKPVPAVLGPVVGDLDATEAADTADLAGAFLPRRAGDIDATQAAHVADLAGATEPPHFAGDLASIEAADTTELAGAFSIPARAGDIGAVEAADTADLAGTTEPPHFAGDLASLEAADSADLAGAVSPPTFAGELISTQQNDEAALAGTTSPPVFSGDVDAAAIDDSAQLAGVSEPPHFVGNLDAVQADQEGSWISSIDRVGDLAATEADAVAMLAGAFSPPIFAGALEATEADSVGLWAGVVVLPVVTGALASSQQDQELELVGAARGPVQGALVAAAADDIGSWVGRAGLAGPWWVPAPVGRTTGGPDWEPDPIAAVPKGVEVD